MRAYLYVLIKVPRLNLGEGVLYCISIGRELSLGPQAFMFSLFLTVNVTTFFKFLQVPHL